MKPRREDAPIVCYGELLWDCLPRGRFLGGAPLNVAYHLARLGRRSQMISAVGADDLGDEALRLAGEAGVDISMVGRRSDVATGTVRVKLDEAGQGHYVFSRPAAWDFIGDNNGATPAMRAAMRTAGAFIFDTLALRDQPNRTTLTQLLAEPGPLKIFDINLRPPFDDLPTLTPLLRQADWVKLNENELARVAGVATVSDHEIARHLAQLQEIYGVTHWCVTLGPRGAVWWDGATAIYVPAPPVVVRDTVGAGDAFLAALVDGLLRAANPPHDWPGTAAMTAILNRACRLGALVASRDGACPEYRLDEIDGPTPISPAGRI